MSTPLLFNVLFAWKCSNTHHKLALDALRHLQGADAERWRNFFLANIERYLEGSKAPDNSFKDFRNHVLHVGENFWGGAVTSTQTWYAKARQALTEKRWSDAVFAVGVLSHYYSDPWQPFHTGQSEAEGVVHRAAEWSIACSYLELQQILEQDFGGYPDIMVPDGDDWLAEMVREAATTAHDFYQPCIDHYNFEIGRKIPVDGYDQEGKDTIAMLLGSAVVGFARILDRLFAEAGVKPPGTNLTLLGVMAQLTVPIFWVTKKMKDTKEQRLVEAMYKEFQQTGKVINTLSEDDRTLRKLHAEEVLQKPLTELDQEPVGAIGSAYGTGTAPRSRTPAAPTTPKKSPEKPAEKPVVNEPAPKSTPAAKPAAATSSATTRFYLATSDELEAAPSIGPKTAERLSLAGLKTVGDLLSADADQVAKKLNMKHIDPPMLRSWQQQARLVCEVPGLRGHDAQILVACHVPDALTLGTEDTDDLLSRTLTFVKTPSGERILRDGKPPDRDEVQRWIASAQTMLNAA